MHNKAYGSAEFEYGNQQKDQKNGPFSFVKCQHNYLTEHKIKI